MTGKFLKDAFGWGFGLWFFGYVLGFVFFAIVPPAVMGWYIMPFGLVAAMWVLMKKVTGTSLEYYARVAFVWTILAILFDYIFIVLLLHPADGYYKLDVYIYYALTLILPIKVGWWKLKKLPSTS